MKFSVLNPERQTKAKQLDYLLVHAVRGVLEFTRGSEKHNGVVVWQKIKTEYQLDVGDRFAAVLMGVLQPGWDPNARSQEFTNALM
eukprot:190748-Pyramimonas_sp.AAC.1